MTFNAPRAISHPKAGVHQHVCVPEQDFPSQWDSTSFADKSRSSQTNCWGVVCQYRLDLHALLSSGYLLLSIPSGMKINWGHARMRPQAAGGVPSALRPGVVGPRCFLCRWCQMQISGSSLSRRISSQCSNMTFVQMLSQYGDEVHFKRNVRAAGVWDLMPKNVSWHQFPRSNIIRTDKI